MLNGGFLTCGFFVASDFNLFAITPFIQLVSLATYGDVGLLIGNGLSTTNIAIGLMLVLCILCYGLAAYALYRFCISQVDVIADRPRRSGTWPTPDRFARRR